MRDRTRKQPHTSGGGAVWSKPVSTRAQESASTLRPPAAPGREGENMKRIPAGDPAREVMFELVAEPGSRVFVAGTFNNWNPTATPLAENPTSGHFKASVDLPPGRHEYKFVVNGVWCVDPKCPEWTPNDYGSLNSVIQV